MLGRVKGSGDPPSFQNQDHLHDLCDLQRTPALLHARGQAHLCLMSFSVSLSSIANTDALGAALCAGLYAVTLNHVLGDLLRMLVAPRMMVSRGSPLFDELLSLFELHGERLDALAAAPAAGLLISLQQA